MMSRRLAMIGDFNIHCEKSSDFNVKRFADLVDSVDTIQHVRERTHIDDHTTDLVLKRAENHGIVSTRTSSLLSDPSWIECIVDMIKPSVPKKIDHVPEIHGEIHDRM